jgi:hypothetical protein
MNWDTNGRSIKIRFQDAGDAIVYPVSVQLRLDGRAAGSLVTDRDHTSAVLLVGDGGAHLQVAARFGSHELVAELAEDATSHTFVFPISRGNRQVAATAEARCPDGTTGVPCVVCRVGETYIRICVS